MIITFEMFELAFFFLVTVSSIKGIEPTVHCRERSNHLRQDGGLCFEIPPWQHQPVELEQHLNRLREKWGNNTTVRRQLVNGKKLVLVNSEVSRYMDTVLAPFLDTYHRNIQSSYQQLTSKILTRTKEEINAAVIKKQEIYKQLTNIADELHVSEMCDEERRSARTLASQHVAHIYFCTEEARASIAKMGRYVDEMISITRSHMQSTLDEATIALDFNNKTFETSACLKELSRAAVALGYEIDLSLTNARRHNEQTCEKLTSCSNKVKRNTDDSVTTLKNELYQCVYA